MTTYTVKFTKTKDAPPVGVYTPTSLDVVKQNADFRLIAIDGPWYSISWHERHGGHCQTIKGKRAFKKLAKQHDWQTDF